MYGAFQELSGSVRPNLANQLECLYGRTFFNPSVFPAVRCPVYHAVVAKPSAKSRRPVDRAQPPAAAAAPAAARPRRRGRRRCGDRPPARARQRRHVRLSYAVVGATSPWHRNGIGDELAYVERGHARVETVFGAFDVREGHYVLLPRATTTLDRSPRVSRGMSSRCAFTSSRRRATSARRNASCLSTRNVPSLKKVASSNGLAAISALA